jgi:Oxidoreductase molybdopterin binding domain
MSSAALDRLLAALVLAMAGTGLLSLRSGTPADGWVFGLHAVLGGCLAAAVAVKLRRSVPAALRRRSSWRLLGGLAVTVTAAAALAGGFAWVAGGRYLSVAGWSVLTIHAWIGLVLLPIVVLHLLPRRWRLLRPGPSVVPRATSRISRRSVLAAGGLVAVGGALAVAADALDALAGGARRFTGSRSLEPGGIPPTTTFFGEPTPAVDAAGWRVAIAGRVARSGSWTLDELAALGVEDRTVILDCTSGWAIETTWRGISLGAVLEAAGVVAGARRVAIRSVTGWSAVLPLDEATGCLLATDVAGGPLPAGNGAPLRLVAADRRGLDWVKWVERIEVV